MIAGLFINVLIRLFVYDDFRTKMPVHQLQQENPLQIQYRSYLPEA